MRLFFLITFFLPFAAMASIHHVKTMEEISHYFDEADSSTLAAFDIDMVLIQPAEPAFQMANIKKHAPIVRKVLRSLTKDEQIVFFSLETVRSYPILIETHTNYLMQDLDDRGIKRIAITANLTGAFDCKDNMQKWTVERLGLCGIDFSQSFPCREKIIFENLPTFRYNNMTFYKGVLFSNGLSDEKGNLLAEFLKRVNFEPEKIIVVDDRLDNLVKIESALEKTEIEFIGLHYTGALDYQSPMIDEERFEAIWWNRAEEAKRISEEMHILPIQ